MTSSEQGGILDGEPVGDEDAQARQRADAVIAELYARQPENAVERRLDAVERVLDILGSPEKAYPVIHITGTNGKSSTARIIAAILRAHGLKVGIFTSPHMVRLNERIDVDGPISDTMLVETWEDIAPYVAMVDAQLAEEGRAPLTFFEAVTVLAFAAYAEAACDVVVLEVGMGGEWDATNVATGQVAVFTPIDMDHAAFLGDTIAQIARTKAGIIKPGAIVVTAAQDPAALTEIVDRAEREDAEVKQFGVDFALESAHLGVGGQELTVRGLAGRYTGLLLPLLGAHQASNATLAVAAVEAFLGGGTKPLTADVLGEGLLRAVSPGRLQLVHTDPSIVLDAAHNPHGARALAQGLRDSFAFPKTIGVVGILADKDARGVLTALEPVLDEVIVTASASPRAIPVEELATLVGEVFGPERVTIGGDVPQAIALAKSRAVDGAGVVVTGSITVIGEAAALIARERAQEAGGSA